MIQYVKRHLHISWDVSLTIELVPLTILNLKRCEKSTHQDSPDCVAAGNNALYVISNSSTAKVLSLSTLRHIPQDPT